MTQKFRRRRDRPKADINITNLVDVTLTLLIVFMIVAPLLKQGLEIELPESAVAKDIITEDQVILVECDRMGTVHINQTEVVAGAVEERIRALLEEYGEVPVQLRADKDLTYGDVIGIVGRIKAAGVETIDAETQLLSIGD
jgi:biopolymer transport protein TolR